MNVLSLFDGLSGAKIALDQLGIDCNYYASEIDKYAIQVSKKNYPDIIHLGNIEFLNKNFVPHIDLLIGGSPCQGFSFAGKQLNFEDHRSKLFFEYVRLLKELKPKYFLLENVKMKKEYQDIISEQVGIEPIEINSALLTAQNRRRLYWTNIPRIEQPEDKGILLADILEHGVVDRDKSYCIDACYYKGGDLNQYFNKSRRQVVFKDILCINPKRSDGKQTYQQDRIYSEKGKSCALSATLNGRFNIATEAKHTKLYYRKLTPIECERLQGIPDNYTQILNKKFYLLHYKEKITKGMVMLCNARLRTVKEKQQHIDMVNSVFYIINDLKDMELQSCLKKNITPIKNVNIVIERLEKKAVEQEECVINITKIGLDTEIHYIQTMLENLSVQGGMKKGLVVKIDTGLYMRIILGESLNSLKKYIILILIKLIIELKIYTYVKHKANILFCINSLRESQENLLKLVLSDLRMENIIFCSDTQRYKMIGNGFTVPVIKHILRHIYGGE